MLSSLVPSLNIYCIPTVSEVLWITCITKCLMPFNSQNNLRRQMAIILHHWWENWDPERLSALPTLAYWPLKDQDLNSKLSIKPVHLRLCRLRSHIPAFFVIKIFKGIPHHTAFTNTRVKDSLIVLATFPYRNCIALENNFSVFRKAVYVWMFVSIFLILDKGIWLLLGRVNATRLF